jgi:hypothetical protein
MQEALLVDEAPEATNRRNGSDRHFA